VTTSQLSFPDYGDDGDVAGARRSRRAFRLCVAALIVLTMFSYIAERFLRYGQAESNFLSGITLPRDSARVLLQSAIRLDAAASKTPTSKYTQALAVREEDDAALEVYARAFEMDPNSSFFAIRYGCRLYLLGKPEQALEKFRHAGNQPPGNSLPRYLEAAAAARADRSAKGPRGAIVLLSRANNTRDPLSFPKPIWFSGYPQTGTQYAFLSREIFAESTAPLYTLVHQVLRAVENDPEPRHSQDAKTWLDQIVTMGERLVTDAEPVGTLQAIAGVSFQMQALALLEKTRTAAGDETADALKPIIERQVKLRQALDRLNEFEAGRDAQLAAIELEFWRPIQLAFITLGALILAYMLARGLHAVLRYRKTAWALPHSTLGKAVLGIGPATLLALLALMAVFQHLPLSQPWYLGVLSTTWWGVVAVLAGFGVIYPGLRLAAPEDVSKKSGRLEDMPEVARLARQAYRRVYAAFVVRYYGILCGVYVCMICVWVLGYRVGYGLYPTQINLLASGLVRQEQEVVRSVIALLS
jgi:tetratricopeptide (TPR) repeat protein